MTKSSKDNKEEVLKNGLMGKLNGYRIHGKSYDAEGNQIDEKHEEDCPCCRKSLFTNPKSTTKQERERTLGDMIAELENDISAYRKADMKLAKLKAVLVWSPAVEQKRILKCFMKYELGLSDEEIGKILV